MAEKAGVNTIHKFDIIKFAQELINEVEQIRAYSSLVDTDSEQKFNLPTESRINTFFRLIGLPMFVTIESKGDKDTTSGFKTGNQHLTPGFDKSRVIDFGEVTIKDANKIGTDQISSILSTRESLLLQREKNIGSDDFNKYMTLAFTKPIPLSPNVPKKDGAGSVGKGDSQRPVFKKLKPLITSYKNVFPKSHEVARPFLPDPINAKVDNSTSLKKPFIETVARIRLIESSTSGNTASKTKQNDFLTSITNSLGSSLFNQIFGESKTIFQQANVLEQFILSKLLSTVNQIANKRVLLEREQKRLAGDLPFQIAVKTTSSRQNPLGKVSSVSADVTLLEKSQKGRLLNKLNVAVAKDEALLSLLPTDDTVNSAGSTPNQAGTKNVVKSALVNPFVNILNNDLNRNRKEVKRIKSQIKKATQEAENLRLELEMMTGEFTGISIPDVVSVIIALFLISKSDLMALLDRKVKEDMAKDTSLTSAVSAFDSSSSGGSEQEAEAALKAVKNLEKRVDDVFELLNAQANAIRDRSKRTKNLNSMGKKVKRTAVKTKSASKDQADVASDAGGGTS